MCPIYSHGILHIKRRLAGHTNVQAASRQCGGSTGIVCCDNSANAGLACLTNITQMFNNIKTVMEFRVFDASS